MKSIIGIVLSVYMDENDQNTIGFKININNKIIDIIVPLDDYNSKIYKDDKVIIYGDVINNKKKVKIRLYE